MIYFSKLARGPAWERWIILEDQNGDMALAGEAILTYTDDSSYAELDCDVLFYRDISESEMDEIVASTFCTVLSGRGNLTVYSGKEVFSKSFSMVDEEELESPN